MSVGTEGSSPNPRTYSRAEYAALEAENARLVAEVEELDDLRKRQSELLSAAAIAIRGPEPALTRYSHADIPERVKMVVADRDAAIAQLAAIQGGMGEEVEVSRWPLKRAHDFLYSHDEVVDAKDHDRLIAQHQRITAAMAAEVERLSRMLNNATNDGIKLADERDALAAENEALVRNLRGKHSLVGATYEHLIRQRDEALAKLAELAAIEGQEPVLWFRSLIGAQCKPDGRCYDVVFSPCEGFMPLYALPPASPDVEGLVNELQRIAEKCSDPDATDALDTALSTWRQAQEGKP